MFCLLVAELGTPSSEEIIALIRWLLSSKLNDHSTTEHGLPPVVDRCEYIRYGRIEISMRPGIFALSIDRRKCSFRKSIKCPRIGADNSVTTVDSIQLLQHFIRTFSEWAKKRNDSKRECQRRRRRSSSTTTLLCSPSKWMRSGCMCR